MKTKATISSVIASVASLACIFACAPFSLASEGAVTAAKSFPSYTQSRNTSLTSEATSTTVEDDSKWGSIESLDVPKTKSQAEKDAEAKAKAQAEAEAANRNQQREQLNTTTTQNNTQQNNTATQQDSAPAAQAPAAQPTTTTTVSSSGASAAIAARALALVGSRDMDCTALVSAALAAAGISFRGWPSQYASLGTPVSLSALQPGDILIWGDAHVAVYVGGGSVVHGGWNFNGEVVLNQMLSVNTWQYSGYPTQAIRIG